MDECTQLSDYYTELKHKENNYLLLHKVKMSINKQILNHSGHSSEKNDSDDSVSLTTMKKPSTQGICITPSIAKSLFEPNFSGRSSGAVSPDSVPWERFPTVPREHEICSYKQENKKKCRFNDNDDNEVILKAKVSESLLRNVKVFVEKEDPYCFPPYRNNFDFYSNKNKQTTHGRNMYYNKRNILNKTNDLMEDDDDKVIEMPLWNLPTIDNIHAFHYHSNYRNCDY